MAQHSRAMEIRELDPSEADRAVALWGQCQLVRPWNDPHGDLRRALDGATSTVLAVFDAGLLVGTAMVGHDGHRGWVYYLAVSPERRGEGIGRLLMDAAEDWLREHGAPKIQLMVRGGNDAVLGFYDALGYTDQETVVLGRFLDPELEARRRSHVRATDRVTPDRPEIVCLCGSTRLADEMNAVNRELTFAGVIVLAPGVFLRAEDREAGESIPETQKAALDAPAPAQDRPGRPGAGREPRRVHRRVDEQGDRSRSRHRQADLVHRPSLKSRSIESGLLQLGCDRHDSAAAAWMSVVAGLLLLWMFYLLV